MLGFKLIHVSKRGHWSIVQTQTSIRHFRVGSTKTIRESVLSGIWIGHLKKKTRTNLYITKNAIDRNDCIYIYSRQNIVNTDLLTSDISLILLSAFQQFWIMVIQHKSHACMRSCMHPCIHMIQLKLEYLLWIMNWSISRSCTRKPYQ